MECARTARSFVWFFERQRSSEYDCVMYVGETGSPVQGSIMTMDKAEFKGADRNMEKCPFEYYAVCKMCRPYRRFCRRH